MLVQRLEQYQKEIKQRKRLDETRRKVEVLQKQLKQRRDKMYGKKMAAPKKKMTPKQKTLPKSLQNKIMASKKKK